MKRPLLVTAFVLGSTGLAAAGPYIGFALGPSPAVDSSISPVSDGAGRTGRIFGGYRLPKIPFVGALSIEASLTGSSVRLRSFGLSEWSGREGAVWGKYSYPLAPGFELFGKLGLHTLKIDHETESYSDSGVTIAVGAEYALKLPMAQASLFVDYEYSRTNFADYLGDLNTRQWMLGFSLGL